MTGPMPANMRASSPVSSLWLLGLIAAVVVLVELGGESWQYALRYERDRALDGEYWRLLTGHFVHGSAQHLLLNSAGLALVAVLFPRHLSTNTWLVVIGLSIAAIDIGFVLWEPQVHWYVGLSGVLHGALAAGAVSWWMRESKGLALALTLVLIAKLAWEQWVGALPLSGDMTVIVDAHLYGAVGGAVAGVLHWIRSQDWPSRARSL